MIFKMVGQGLLAAAIVAALAYGYQSYRDGGVGVSVDSIQEIER